MTKKRRTRRALVSSVISLLICFSMLLGTTFAWFTDEVNSTNNIIKAGNLDVELYYQVEGQSDWIQVDENTNVFMENALWEPGHTEVVKLKVVNEGTLALKSDLGVNIVSEEGSTNVAGIPFKLSDYIMYGIIDGDQDYTRDTAVAAVKNEAVALNTTYSSDVINLYPKNNTENKAFEKIITMVVYMPTTVTNDANYDKAYTAPSITLGINLFATQVVAENDSFGPDYDEMAPANHWYVNTAGELQEKINMAKDGDIVVMDGDGDKLVNDEAEIGINTSDSPLTETIVVDKEITLIPGGMYLVSNAPATFTVTEGGKLTVDEGSFTIKNISTEGVAVFVDGGEFVMNGGSFDAHTAIRTAEGKSSVATLAGGWSNRVTVGFDSKGDDTINVTGGSLYTSKEAIKTTAGTDVTINMSGGLLSSGATQYSAAVYLNGKTTVNMTGGTIASTYASGLNGSAAIEANVAPTTINMSGTAKLEAKGWGVTLGSHWSSPVVLDERFVLNVTGDSSINVTGDTGFGIRYCQDACDVTVSGNAKVSAKFHAIQMNSNSYVFANSTLTIAENATIFSTAGRYGGGYGVAANGNVTITGGTITGSTVGFTSTQAGSVVVIDNSVSGTPITINSVDIGTGVDYTVAGNPSIG